MSTKASLKSIIISYEEYERLKKIEVEFAELQKKVQLRSNKTSKLNNLYFVFFVFNFREKPLSRSNII